MRGENMPKTAYCVVKSPQFSPFIRNRGRWTRWWNQFL